MTSLQGYSTPLVVSKTKDDLEREQLLAVVESENKDVLELVEKFNAQERYDADTDKSFCEQIVAAVERVLTAGDWDKSLFLRTTIKPLREVKAQAEQLMVAIDKQSGVTQVLVQDDLNDGQQLVFISLFQAQGFDMQRWALQLRSIQKHLAGRPVYVKEDKVRGALRASVSQDRESQAYIIVAVDANDIEQTDPTVTKPRQDRMGNDLLLLKSGVVTPDHIVEFVHNKKRYRLINGRLFLQK